MINEQNGTLVATTVTTITFPTVNEGDVKVINRDTTGLEIWYTDDGTTPTVGGANCYLVESNTSAVSTPSVQDKNTGYVIKLISSGTPKFAVEIVNTTD